MLIVGAVLVACRKAAHTETWQAASTYQAVRDSAGCIVTIITTQRFVPVEEWHGNTRDLMVMRERTTTRASTCRETGESRTHVDAFPGFAAPSVATIWQLDAEGADGVLAAESGQRLYRLTVPGCCDVPSVDRYFSLENGRHLFDTDVPLVQVANGQPGGRGDRFLAVEDGNGVRHPPEQGHDSSFAAVIAYGDDANPAERVVVTAPDGYEYSVDSVRLVVDDTVSPYHEALFPRSGRLAVAMVLRQEGDEPKPIRVTIPLTRDSLAVARAVADSGIRVHRVPALGGN